MKETRFAALPRLTVVTMLTVALGGCWSSGPGAPKAEKRDPVPIPASAITVQGQPGTFGGTLTVAIPEPLSTFNPYVLSDPSTTEVLGQIYAPLVGFNPTTGKVLPQDGLAQSFEADGKKVTVHMREGLSFSDGTPIRADDVVYSLKVATDEQVHAPIADMLTVNGRLPDIELVDPKTLTLEFTEPYPAIGYVLSQLRVISAGADPEATINRGHYEEALNVDTAPDRIACSGPFKIGTFEKGKRITLDYNPNYWKVDSQSLRLPYLDHMAYEFGLAPDEVGKRLETGSLGLAVDLDPTVFNGLGAGRGNCVTKDLGVGYGTWQMFGNMDYKLVTDRVKTAWTRDPKFREFMSRIVDRDAIVKEVFAGKAAPAEGLVSPANATWHNASIKKYTYDQTGALTALGDAFHVVEREGKPQVVDVVNRPVKLNLYYPKTAAGEGIQKIIADRLTKAGVPVKPVGVEPSKLLSQYLVPGKFEIAIWRMDGFGPDPISYIPVLMQNGTMHWYLHTDAGASSPFEWETLIGRLMRSQQDKKLDADRQKDFNEAQKLWAENNPVTYIVADNVLLAYDKRLGNFQPVAFRPYATWNSEQLFIKQ
jgi:peptide/nickel transport system substrate-binding protein